MLQRIVFDPPTRSLLRGLVNEAELLTEAIVDTVDNSVLLLTDELRVHLANQSFYVTFQMLPAETLDHYIYELDNGQWNLPALRYLLEGILPQNTVFENYDVEHEFASLGRKVMRLNARKLRRRVDQRELILLVIQDVTALRQAAEERERLHQLERERLEQQLERERLERQVEATGTELDRTKEELRALTAQLLTVQDEERRRIAYELHDDLAQRLTVLGLGLDRLKDGLDAPRQERAADLAHLRERVGLLTDDLRTMSYRLYPDTLEHLGLTVSLRQLVNDFARHWPMPVDFAVHSLSGRTSLLVATALYRIVQEALHNITKHAPGSSVAVLLSKTDDVLELTIEDTGPGFDPQAVRAKGRLGLVSMGERARLLGGTLQIDSHSGKGTTITAQVPLLAAGTETEGSTPLVSLA